MSRASEADIVIAGAGPAGAWTARTLAAAGARVVLVDPSHPREKPCGGGITGRALERVAAAVDLDALPRVPIRRALFTDPRGGPDATVDLTPRGGGQPLIVASRETFDGRLLDAAVRAGAQLHRARVHDVARNGSRLRVETTVGAFDARFVVGADGANSLVRRKLSRALPRDQISIATGYFVRGRTSDAIALAFTGNPPGYLWSFPRPTHLAVGICAQADAGVTAAALRARAAGWIEANGLAGGAPLVPYSWPIPSLTTAGLAANAVAGPGWCLVGDAAGLVDPITREGIFFAIESAELAAAALARAGRAEATYEAAVRDTIVPELARAARLKAAFFRPRVTELLVDALRESDGIRRVMADLVAGRQGYRGLGLRLARTWEIGLAWKAVRELGTRNSAHP